MQDGISETGYWTFGGRKFEEEHMHDEALADALVDLAQRSLLQQKLYDFGCGPGKYVENFRKNNIKAIGFDGNPVTQDIPHCIQQDLTDASFSIEPVDFLLSLEVAEHIPRQYESVYLENLNKHVKKGGVLVLSWAIVGQGGYGHVNCKDNKDVIPIFENLGYVYDANESQKLRTASSLSHFRHTLMVFHKQ